MKKWHFLGSFWGFHYSFLFFFCNLRKKNGAGLSYHCTKHSSQFVSLIFIISFGKINNTVQFCRFVLSFSWNLSSCCSVDKWNWSVLAFTGKTTQVHCTVAVQGTGTVVGWPENRTLFKKPSDVLLAAAVFQLDERGR